MGTSLQQQARALGDGTRHGIFRYLADAGAPVDVAELTAHFGLNHNAIRQHLTKLVAAELVVETKAPSTGRGRPRLRYAVAPSADGRWGVTGPYERLSLLLSEMLRTGDSATEVGRRAARRRYLGASRTEGPLGELVEEMTRSGFDPELRQHRQDFEIVLRHCPFAATAQADPDTTCGLHLGMAYGVADSTGGLVIDSLAPRDPHEAGCRLRCHLDPSVTAVEDNDPASSPNGSSGTGVRNG